MKMLKYSILIIITAMVFFACSKDGDGGDSAGGSDPCSGVDKDCPELTAEDFESLCNAQNLTLSFTTSSSTSPFVCKYKIRNDDGVVLLLNLSHYSSCFGPQNQFDFDKEFLQTDFIPIDNLNDDSHYYETSAFRTVQSVKGKTLIDLTGYNDTDCGSQDGLIKLMKELNDKLF